MKHAIAIVLALAAARTAAADPAQDHCEVHLTGDVKADLVADHARGVHVAVGKAMATTDYWLTDDDLRQALEMMAKVMTKAPDAARVKAKVDEGMKKDPRLVLLLINCGTDDGLLTMGPGGKSHYADVPFAPKKYAIAPTSAASKPGDMGVMLGLHHGKDHQSFLVSDPGTLDITKFDATGIAGTFHFAAKEMRSGKKVVVDGKFDYGCVGGHKCK